MVFVFFNGLSGLIFLLDYIGQLVVRELVCFELYLSVVLIYIFNMAPSRSHWEVRINSVVGI